MKDESFSSKDILSNFKIISTHPSPQVVDLHSQSVPAPFFSTMAEQIRDTFRKCRQEGSPESRKRWPVVGRKALITFVTAGYPTLNDTVSILKAMQDGGTDIIELGKKPYMQLWPSRAAFHWSPCWRTNNSGIQWCISCQRNQHS